jgi:alkanesulfonate monooxygenase SsuD/methylene tetrahydromethanopterin reductase-like flavin-dependent oxidoreductase (luciferase family)
MAGIVTSRQPPPRRRAACGGGRGSLDAWTTLAALAARTSRIRLGTLVSPATFRHPSVLAKSVVTVDHVSGGRVELGLGAGEHYRVRDPETARLSLMATCVVGYDRAEVTERVRRVLAVTGRGGSADQLAEERPGWVLGTVDQVVERLRAIESAGVGRVMLQHLGHADVEMVEVLGEVAATVAAAS